ncbi:MAG: nucleotide exchange factor GrpE [Phycisphaerae bacterium]
MSRKLFTIGLLLFVVGLSALSWVIKHQQRESELRQYYKTRRMNEADAHTKTYQQWLAMPEYERTVLPWQLDESGQPKTAARIQQEQKERLFTDIEELSAKKHIDPKLAESLYGKEWKEKLQQYKSEKLIYQIVIAGSILCGSSGFMLTSWGILVWTINKIKTFGRKKSAKSKKQKDKNETLPDTKPSVQPQASQANQEPPLQQKDDNPLKTKKNTVKFKKTTDYDSQDSFIPGQKPVQKISFERLYTDEDSTGLQKKEQAQVSHMSLAEAIRKRLQGSDIKNTGSESLISNNILNNTLDKLTEEIASIRRYASEQQDRIKKLQDGYDWNIIKNFCLRVIRCIDNLESRIKNFSDDNIDTGELEEIRDELLFALESSGVEQFAPELGSNYKGQEKVAEAVKDKKQSSDAEKSGKIAEILRHGYRYCLDEENYKVIRTSQVRLFDKLTEQRQKR